MKKYILSAAALAILTLSMPGTTAAQDGKKKEKTEGTKKATGEGKKSAEKLSDYEEIVIRKKADGNAKVTVEIKDGEVKVNGKSLDDFESDAVSVRRRKPDQIVYGRAMSPFRDGAVTVNGQPLGLTDANRAFLGVSSEETDAGVKIAAVSENSAAAKAGLKEGDIIVMIDDAKISDPSDVTTAVRKRKPEDKITITYKRDGKENKTTATLGKYEGVAVAGFRAYPDFAPSLERLRDLETFRFDGQAPGIMVTGRPRIGIRAQDTEEGNGAKVLAVTEESAAAKAGIVKDDIITSYDGKTIKSADDLSAASRDAREKSSIEVKLNRGGKSQTVEIKIPKRLKTTTL